MLVETSMVEIVAVGTLPRLDMRPRTVPKNYATPLSRLRSFRILSKIKIMKRFEKYIFSRTLATAIGDCPGHYDEPEYFA